MQLEIFDYEDFAETKQGWSFGELDSVVDIWSDEPDIEPGEAPQEDDFTPEYKNEHCLPMTLAEIGTVLGITEQEARSLYDSAMRKLSKNSLVRDMFRDITGRAPAPRNGLYTSHSAVARPKPPDDSKSLHGLIRVGLINV